MKSVKELSDRELIEVLKYCARSDTCEKCVLDQDLKCIANVKKEVVLRFEKLVEEKEMMSDDGK